MKSELRNPRKIASIGTMWTPSRTGSNLRVMEPAKIQRPVKPCGPDVVEDVFPHSASPWLPTDEPCLEGARGAGLRTLLGLRTLSSSPFISALRALSLEWGSLRKDTCFIDMMAPFREAFRRLMDIISAVVGLILTAPLFLVIAILIKLDSRGPVIYKQVRVGQNRRHGDRRKHCHRFEEDRRNGDRRKRDHHGCLFVIYKFRSMRQGAEKKIGPVHARKDDPRITKVGKFLRPTRGDELPQLFNILKGDMSLVGPKSERPYFVGQFMDSIPHYRKRLKVKPGLFGVEQVGGGRTTYPDDMLFPLNYD
jgi:lipopolysaccharide/colanic/teichoic acid biosynthesis glycosyltransferase